MDEIEKRLRELSDNCVKAYLDWQGKKRDPATREALQDAIHEMRKVSARLEIEIAVSERDEMVARPIPIPPHRATRKGGPQEEADDNAGNFAGNEEGQGGEPRQGVPRQVLRRRSQHHGGGGGGRGPGRGGEE